MLKGVVLLLLSELCFASATVFGKLVTNSSEISGVEITFFRFFLGFFLALFYVGKEKKSLVPAKVHLVVFRGIFNTVAVIFFFLSVQYTTITNANMLNLTYPVFVFALAPFINKEKSRPVLFVFLLMTMSGIFLVIHPDFKTVNRGDMYGLVSGISAAFGVTTLKQAKEYDSTTTILFYLMLIGTIINFIVMIPGFIIPQGRNILYIVISALLGITGQVLITTGYRYVSSKAGALVSSARIIYAAIMGTLIFHDVINVRVAVGGLLVITSIFMVTLLSGTTQKRIEIIDPTDG
jgi:drug/metabolite transporter (DMT)-like permease